MGGIRENLIGKVFGRLVVVSETDKRRHKSILWECKCSCGNTHFANTKHLKRGHVKSCGCLMRDPASKSRNFIGEDLTGRVYGKLTVIKYSHSDKFQHRRWECRCECGNISCVDTSQLNSKNTTSCGCMGSKSGNRRGELAYNYSGYRDITGSRWYSLISGAKSRKLDVFINKEDVWCKFEKQMFLCALSKLPISFKDNTASVDRIDSGKHYTPDNIQIIHKDINRMKNNFNQEYFIEMCKLIAENN